MTRTDIHRPSAPEFNPENYQFITCFDLHSEYGDADFRRETVNTYIAQGYRFAIAGEGCAHCGKNIRYAALMLHAPTMEILFIGEQCLNNRFQNLTKGQFQKLREQGRLNRDRVSRKEKCAAFAAAHPEVQMLIDYEREVDAIPVFLSSLLMQFENNGSLSDKQLAAIEPAIIRDREQTARANAREIEANALRAAGVRAPSGRVTVTGKIVGFKTVESDFYGDTVKMIVQSVDGWKVYVTAPAGSADANVGDEVTFSAQLTPSQDDVLFAFGKRPTKFTLKTKENA